ncbi:MAG: hypothetical protein ACX98W_07970, partial [bacterium]
ESRHQDEGRPESSHHASLLDRSVPDRCFVRNFSKDSTVTLESWLLSGAVSREPGGVTSAAVGRMVRARPIV